MSTTQKTIAHFVGFLAKPAKWIANTLLFILLLTFFILLLGGNPLITFINVYTIMLVISYVAAMALHVFLTRFSERLRNEPFVMPSYEPVDIDIQSLNKHHHSQRKNKGNSKPSAKVVNMSDWRR